MRNLTLHPLWHTVMPVYQHAISLCSQSLSALALYLMITKTPLKGEPWARYLMLIQISIILVDLNFGILFCPILLYPVPGLLCTGPLCTVFGFSGHTGCVLVFLTMWCCVLAFVFAFHIKFLTLLQMTKHVRLSQRHIISFRIVVVLIFAVSVLFSITLYHNIDSGTEIIRNRFPTLKLTFDNRKYRALAYDTRSYRNYVLLFTSSTIFSMAFTVLLYIIFIGGSFYLLSLKNSKLSDKTRQLQLKMMRLLILQSQVLLALQGFPIAMRSLSIFTETLNPDINNAFLCVQ